MIAQIKDYIWLEAKKFPISLQIFYNMICDSEIEVFRVEIIKELNTNFSSFVDTYWRFAIEKVIDYEMFFSQYVDYINKQCIFYDEDVIIASQNPLKNKNIGAFPNIYLFISLFRFIHFLDISLENEELTHINKDCNFKHFLLSPFPFDYNNFRIEWLYFFSDNSDKKIYEFWAKNPQIKEQLTLSLKESPNEKLGEIYLKYFI